MTDSTGAVWTMNADTTISMNGSVIPGSGGTAYVTVEGGVVYAQDASTGTWYTWDGNTLVPTTSPPITPSPAATATPTPTPTPTPSATPNPVQILLGTNPTGSLTDSAGNKWTIANSEVMMNGAPAGFTASVAEIALYNGVIYQENDFGRWYSWDTSFVQWIDLGKNNPLP